MDLQIQVVSTVFSTSLFELDFDLQVDNLCVADKFLFFELDFDLQVDVAVEPDVASQNGHRHRVRHGRLHRLALFSPCFALPCKA